MIQPLDKIDLHVNSQNKFGGIRKYDIHTGIDLFCEEFSNVYAIESGQVINKNQFTGEEVGSPWWNSTDFLLIKGNFNFLYGEIESSLKIGDNVKEGDIIGRVKKVLKVDKGLPMCMLHLELYDNDYKGNGEIWNLGEEQPPMLLDPTDIINDITSESYKLIKSFYKDDVTKRSNVPLINHIDEGLYILNKLKSSSIVKDAYCLHPILQSDDSFIKNKSLDFKGIATESLLLSMEYRRVANSYLSRNKIEDFVGFTCNEIREMLMADKIQNYKDFMLYHYGTHDRSNELYEYFNNWFSLLNIDITTWLTPDFKLK